MNMLLPIVLVIAPNQGPEFIGKAPGEILPVTARAAGGKVDPKAISALLRIKKPPLDELSAVSRYSSGVPPQKENEHHLPVFADPDRDYVLVGLPYATEEKYRDVTMNMGRSRVSLRLPVSKAPLPAVEEALADNGWRNRSLGYDRPLEVHHRSPNLLHPGE